MACSASPNIVAKKKSCLNIIRSANSILFGMSLADAARVAQEVKSRSKPKWYRDFDLTSLKPQALETVW